LIPLAFHVTYWDDLGWRDSYAQKAFDVRHNDRAFAGGGRTVYTPQLFVNGREWRDWRAEGSARRLAETAAAHPARASLALAWRADAKGVEVKARGHLDADRAGLLHIALTENGLASEVTRGENRGKRLRHEHVVRALAGPWSIDAGSDYALNTRIDWPASAILRQSRLAVWISGADGLKGYAAVSASLACAASTP
jgi:hypothetical protein